MHGVFPPESLHATKVWENRRPPGEPWRHGKEGIYFGKPFKKSPRTVRN